MAENSGMDVTPYQEPLPFSVDVQQHSLTFYPAGKDRLTALTEIISSASSTLQLFYYMFQEDAAGTQIRDALADAAARGVRVDLLVDRFGTDASESFFSKIVENGGHFALFSSKVSRRYLIRNHQKICIADKQIAMVGGFNVSDHYFNGPDKNGWCDLGCKMTGPVVQDLLRWYEQLRDWTRNPGSQYRAIRSLVREWDPGSKNVRLTLGGPTRAPSNWARQVKSDLARGGRLDMVMAYFSPPRSFRQLMKRLAERGRARLITAGKSDNKATIAASRALYGGLIRSGTDIFEFQPTKLHMKLIVIDDAVYFGSANFDHRSIRINLEMMFRFEDAELAARMRQFIDDLENASLHITRAVHRAWRNPWSLFKWWLGWTAVSVIDYTVTRSLNNDD